VLDDLPRIQRKLLDGSQDLRDRARAHLLTPRYSEDLIGGFSSRVECGGRFCCGPRRQRSGSADLIMQDTTTPGSSQGVACSWFFHYQLQPETTRQAGARVGPSGNFLMWPSTIRAALATFGQWVGERLKRRKPTNCCWYTRLCPMVFFTLSPQATFFYKASGPIWSKNL